MKNAGKLALMKVMAALFSGHEEQVVHSMDYYKSGDTTRHVTWKPNKDRPTRMKNIMAIMPFVERKHNYYKRAKK